MPKHSSTWPVFWPVAVATALSLLGDTAMYTVLPTHNDQAGVAVASIGILLSANRWVRFASNGGVGWLAERWPRRWLFVPALFLGVLSTALYALTRGFWFLLVARLLWGVAWSGIWVVGNAIILDAAAEHQRGRWVGFYHTSFFMGGMIGAPLGGILTDAVGYGGAMGILALFMFGGAVCALLFLPETRPHPTPTNPITPAELPPATPIPDEKAPAWRPLLTTMGLLLTNRLLVSGFLLATFGRLLAERWGETMQIGAWEMGIATATGLGLGLTTIMSMISSSVAGGVSDRLGSRWRTAAGGLLLMAAGFLALSQATSVWFIVLGFPLISLGSGSLQSLSTVLMGDLVHGRQRGRYLGIFYTVGDGASALGPLLAYAILASGAGFGWLYGFACGLALLMFLAVSLREGR